MSGSNFYPFYPQRLLWAGIASLAATSVFGAVFLGFWIHRTPIAMDSQRGHETANESVSLSFSLGLKETPVSFPLPKVESEVTFSFDSPRPDIALRGSDIFVRFRQTGQSKKIALPCRIDLEFLDGEKLGFADKESLFWLDLTRISEGKIQGVVSIRSGAELPVQNGLKETIEVERFVASQSARPLQGAQEFPENSPFRILSEARWLGKDVFAEKYGGGQTSRIAVGNVQNGQILDIRENEWIVWEDGRWIHGPLDEKLTAVARIESADSKVLILEGWEAGTHARISLTPATASPFKMRGEEVFNSIRVRSEKQISCMMDKQCLILRGGDWVVKSGGRWKILRKKEEREFYKSGKISGELFAFDRIESKQGQKFIVGSLFNSEKTQIVPVDLAANQRNPRKEQRKIKEK